MQYYPTHCDSQYSHKQQVLTTSTTLVPIDVTINAESTKTRHSILACTLPHPGISGMFQEHVLQFNPWEYSLLTNVVLTEDPFTISSIFMSQASPLQAAMDGSVANSNERFGWTISTTGETRLITCHGPVYGRAPTSNCAKCYANLSILRFLLQLHIYKGEPTPLFEIYTNSQSLITTIHLSKWTLYFPSTTLQPEWDMLQAITTTLQKLHSRPKFIHGKSHQDNQQDYTTLPL